MNRKSGQLTLKRIIIWLCVVGGCIALIHQAVAFDPVFELSSLDGTNGFVINGIDNSDKSGQSVSGAGDINGDGIDDVIIGAPGVDSDIGESYVVFGDQSGFNASLDLSSLDGTNGFVMVPGGPLFPGQTFGVSVSGTGDINGDGIDDLIIGAEGTNSNAGKSYVVFGDQSGFNASLDLSSLDGTNGFVINGINTGDFFAFGKSVSGAGDINGDGIDDLIIGAPGGDPNGNSNAGESYVIFGQSDQITSPIPEPSTYLMLMFGVVGIVATGYRRRQTDK